MSGIFGFNEAAAVAAFSAICAWATHVFPRSRSTKAYYKKYNPKWSTLMGLQWFRWGWVMETACLTLTIFYFAQNTPADSWNIIAGTVLFFAHLFALRTRNMLFWDARRPSYAVGVGSTGLILTTIGFYICMLLHNIQGLYWVPLIPFSVYTAHMLLGVGWMTSFYRNWLAIEFPKLAERTFDPVIRIPLSFFQNMQRKEY